MTYRQTIVAARDVQSGDFINGARVTRVDPDTTLGVIYVWTSAHDVDHTAAHMILNHGDPVRIERYVDERHLEADLDAAERAANGAGASGILYR